MKQSIYISSTFLYYWELYKENLTSMKSQYTYWSDLNSFVEFCKKDFIILGYDEEKDVIVEHTLEELLPYNFDI